MPQALSHVFTYQLEHQNPSKTIEKMGYFDRVTVSSLHILYTANQETVRASKIDTSCLGRPSGDVQCASEDMACGLVIFKTANNKVDLGQIRSEEIVYNRFIKIPLG